MINSGQAYLGHECGRMTGGTTAAFPVATVKRLHLSIRGVFRLKDDVREATRHGVGDTSRGPARVPTSGRPFRRPAANSVVRRHHHAGRLR